MPAALREISGLALTADGQLLAHSDERGVIYVIDPKLGELKTRFSFGKSGVLRDDFEGITVANGVVYVLASNGTLYEFKKGNDGEKVPVRVIDTKLGKECEFEGVAFDPAISALLLACKTVGTKSLRDHLVIYRWRIGNDDGGSLPPLTIPLSMILGERGGKKKLHPSDITVDPTTGHYVLVAAQEQALVEITPSGAVVRAEPLPEGHEMTEGIAISRDGILMLSDEATRASATITLYRWKRQGGDSLSRQTRDTASRQATDTVSP